MRYELFAAPEDGYPEKTAVICEALAGTEEHDPDQRV